MLDKLYEIYPGIDLHIYSRDDTPNRYVIGIANKRKGRYERIVNFHATITQVNQTVQYLLNLKTKVFEKSGKEKEG